MKKLRFEKFNRLPKVKKLVRIEILNYVIIVTCYFYPIYQPRPPPNPCHFEIPNVWFFCRHLKVGHAIWIYGMKSNQIFRGRENSALSVRPKYVTVMAEWMTNMYLLPSHQLENGDSVIYSVSVCQEIMNTQRECVCCWDRAMLSASASKDDRNKCLSGGSYLFLVIVTDGV